MGLFAAISIALSHVSTLISGIFIGQQTGANKKPEESIANSTIGSENRHNKLRGQDSRNQAPQDSHFDTLNST